MAKSEACCKFECKLCETSYKSEQELLNHRQTCLINQLMDIKYLETHISEEGNGQKRIIQETQTQSQTQSQTQINIMEQREIIYKQKESIELQKDEIMDQAVQIAEQHKQIMALLASSGDNDNGCDNRTDNDDYDDFYNRG